jgi:excisionase family DNA binding protein
LNTTLDTDLLTVARVAARLGISRSKAYKMLRDGELRPLAVKVFDSSRGFRVRTRDLDTWIEQRRIAPLRIDRSAVFSVAKKDPPFVPVH